MNSLHLFCCKHIGGAAKHVGVTNQSCNLHNHRPRLPRLPLWSRLPRCNCRLRHHSRRHRRFVSFSPLSASGFVDRSRDENMLDRNSNVHPQANPYGLPTQHQQQQSTSVIGVCLISSSFSAVVCFSFVFFFCMSPCFVSQFCWLPDFNHATPLHSPQTFCDE